MFLCLKKWFHHVCLSLTEKMRMPMCTCQNASSLAKPSQIRLKCIAAAISSKIYNEHKAGGEQYKTQLVDDVENIVDIVILLLVCLCCWMWCLRELQV